MKNKYEIRGDVTVIFIESKGRLHEVLIDTEDLEKVKGIERWNINSKNNTDTLYVSSYKHTSKKTMFITNLHRHIMGLEKGDKRVVDHINHNGLDNRKINLRVATVAENGQNWRGAKKGSGTGIRGLSWNKSLNKWQVKLTINKKNIHFGYFDSFEEAEKLSNEAYLKLMPFSRKDGYQYFDENFVEEMKKIKRERPTIANTSGVRGVSFVTSKQLWQAELQINKKTYYFGTFKSKEEAADLVSDIRSGKKKPEDYAKVKSVAEKKSGFKGILWNKKLSKWSTYSYRYGKKEYIGVFYTIDEAKEQIEKQKAVIQP